MSSAVRGSIPLLHPYAFMTLTGAIRLTSYAKWTVHILWPWRTCKTLPKDLAFLQHLNVSFVFAFAPLLHALETVQLVYLHLFIFTLYVLYESIEDKSQISSFFPQFFFSISCQLFLLLHIFHDFTEPPSSGSSRISVSFIFIIILFRVLFLGHLFYMFKILMSPFQLFDMLNHNFFKNLVPIYAFLLFDAIQKISNCLLGLWFHFSIHFLIAQLYR